MGKLSWAQFSTVRPSLNNVAANRFEFIQEDGDFVWYHGCISRGGHGDIHIGRGYIHSGGRLGKDSRAKGIFGRVPENSRTASVVEGVLI